VLSLSNLEKTLYPESRFTKGDVIDYYAHIAEVMLPYIQDRPITLKRYPNGVEGLSFFEKHAPAHLPDWIRTVEVPSKSADHEPIAFAVICDRPTLIWAANLAALEFHVPLWHVSKTNEVPGAPDHMVFDLDPGPGTTIAECCRVASWIAKRIGSPMAAKTSGSKGLQLYLPIADIGWDEAGERAHELARAVENDHGDAVVSVMRKNLRDGKVLIDWSQNSPAKTTVAAYSLRARSTPTVSAPVTWDEIETCARDGDPTKLQFQAQDVLERVERLGDLMQLLLPKHRGRDAGAKHSGSTPARKGQR
jgi:bifunctional non-homologous end joining protein LigD